MKDGYVKYLLFVACGFCLILFGALKSVGSMIESGNPFESSSREYVCKFTDKQIGINLYLEKIKILKKEIK